MSRKVTLTAGIILTLIYALMLLASIFLIVASVVYTFVGESLQIVNDLFVPVLSPFLVFGEDMFIVSTCVITLLVIFSLCASTRYIKYSRFDRVRFARKKSLSVLFLAWFIIVTGVYVYLLVSNIQTNGGFSADIVVNCLLCTLIGLHFVSIILILIALINTKSIAQDFVQTQQVVEVKETQEIPNEVPLPARPAIYTSGLDDEEEKSPQGQKEVQKSPKVELKESTTTKQVIEGISKLDEMRKEGKISITEYTKLRNKLIRKLTKDY